MQTYWRAYRSFGSGQHSPAQARQFCDEQVCFALGSGPDSAAVTADAVLVVSELVTNSVNAGSNDVGLELELHEDHLRIAVSDECAGRPELRAATLADASGRGIRIVQELARAWGVAPRSGGKAVWADLSLPTTLIGSLNHPAKPSAA
jgi:two-component sensor histidine kinase